MKYTYPTIIIPAEEGGYTVLVPDLTGCITEGNTFEEAIDMAKEAMEGWIEVTIEHKEEVPQPSMLEDIVKRLDKILEGIIEEPKEREQIILASVKIDIPKIAA